MTVIYKCLQVPSEHVADTMVILTHGDKKITKGPFCAQCAAEFEALHTGVTPYNPEGETYTFENIPLNEYLIQHPEALARYMFKEGE